MQSHFRNHRIALAGLVFVAANAVPLVLSAAFPRLAAYIPPFFLVALVLILAVELLLLFRPARVLEWLGPGASFQGLPSAKLWELKIGIAISAGLIAFLSVAWVRAWP